MAAVTLVCTTHNERGACTEDALLSILRGLDPDVIFLEMREADLHASTLHTLEARAVRTYAKFRSAMEVAVDDFEIPTSFRHDLDSMFEYIERNSDEFNTLVMQREMAASRGFEALNSADFELLAAHCDEAMERALGRSRSTELVRRYATWTSLLRQREDSMLTNIYSHCRTNPNTRGAFMVGAAHLSSLARGIEERHAREPSVIQWKLWSRPERFRGRATA
jgi:hypothetical protein